jgi:hypothetical protein
MFSSATAGRRDNQSAWAFPAADEGQTAVILDLAAVLAGPYAMPSALPRRLRRPPWSGGDVG